MIFNSWMFRWVGKKWGVAILLKVGWATVVSQVVSTIGFHTITWVPYIPCSQH